jgi:hypothetical protein
MEFAKNESGYPEKRLLALCARTRMEPSHVEAIREIAAHPIDWDFAVSAAAENSMMPLLAKHISTYATDLVPEAALERMRGAARANTLRCLGLTAEMLRIHGELQSGGIQAIPYKGPVTAAQAYGDVSMREYEDLDFVLRQRDLPKADEVMRRLGYRARYPWIHEAEATGSLAPGEYNYREESRGIIAELHTEHTMRHFPLRLDVEDFGGRLAPVDLSGHTLKTFCVEDTLLLLCVHGAKDFWERIIWVADIAELAQRGSGPDWDAVFRRAEKMRMGRMLRVGLALAMELLDAPLPAEVAARATSDVTAATIARELGSKLLEREAASWEGAAIFRYRRRMVTGRIAGWGYAVRLALAPAETDWRELRLPARWARLHSVLRPLRLMRKYGWAGRRTRENVR